MIPSFPLSPRVLGLTALLLSACSTPSVSAPPLDSEPLAEAGVPDWPGLQRDATSPDLPRVDLALPLPPPWTRQIGTSAADHARAVAVDGAGNVYVAGFTSGAMAGAATAGGDDILVVKLGSDGQQIWTRQLGTTERDIALGLAVDAQGQAYVTGSTTGDLQGANAGNDGTCQGATNCPDLFVLKLGSNGAPLWTRQLGTTGDDTSNGIALDGSGIYITGKTAGALDGHSSAGWNDVFLIKYSFDGDMLWSQQFGGFSFDEGRAVATDGQNAVWVTGYMAFTTGNDDVFLSKRSADTGGEFWQRTLASPGKANEEGYAVAVDAAGVFVCGYTMGALPGNSLTGYSDLFVARWAFDGSPGWVKQFGATQANPAFALADALYLGEGGVVYAAGFSNGSLGPTGLGGYDVFVLKLDPDGSKAWARPYGSTAGDRGYGLTGRGSRLVVVGDTEGSVEGNPNLGAADILIQQLEP